ncbi:MAG: DUF7197 family protein [Sulfobacillus sp.]
MALVRDKNAELMEHTIIPFYRNENNLEVLLSVLTDSKISLRVLDWFVTNYAKQYNIVFQIKKYGREVYFFVYPEYKAQLKGYSKKQFDPFCRRNRIEFEYALGSGRKSAIITTIAQLNFFKWAIENGVLDYVEKHLEEITKDMNARGSKSRKNSEDIDDSSLADDPPTSKKKEMSVTASKMVSQHDIVVKVQFK